MGLSNTARILTRLGLGYFSEQGASVDIKLKWRNALETASNWIELYTGRYFVPRWETRRFDIVDRDTLLFDQDFYDDSYPFDGWEYVVETNDGRQYTNYEFLPAGRRPRYGLRLTDGKPWSYRGTKRDAISVTGTWAYNTRIPQMVSVSAAMGAGAWVASEALVTLANENRTIITTTANEYDYDEENPRWYLGDVLRFHKEMCLIVDQSSTTSTWLLRGYNGTASGSRINAVPMRWKVEPQVRDLAERMAIAVFRDHDGQKPIDYEFWKQQLDPWKRRNV